MPKDPDASAPPTLRADEVVEAALAILASLDDRTRRILTARFGVDSGKPKTLQAIGNTENITRERVRQIEHAGLRTIQSAQKLPPRVAAVRRDLPRLLESFGRSALEDTLMEAIGGTTSKHRAALRLFLSSLPGVTEARETQQTAQHWTMNASGPSESDGSPLETVLETGEQALRQARHLLSEADMLAHIRQVLGTSASDGVVRSMLSIGKRIVRTPFGDWGLRGWPEATPRGVGDKAYIVLKRAGKPLHFTAIADGINATGFDAKRAHPQTVHNELIRNARFVLVGRGLYGLREWGYEPGTVVEVLARILQEAARPMPKQDLIAAVLQKRFVKRNTVLLALQDASRFRTLPDGTYTLAASQAPPAAATPERSSAPVPPPGRPPAP